MSRYLLARHESCHAVCCYFFDLQLGPVDITREDGGAVAYTACKTCIPPDEFHLKTVLVSISPYVLLNPNAELVLDAYLLHPRLDPSSRHDFELARKHLRLLKLIDDGFNEKQARILSDKLIRLIRERFSNLPAMLVIERVTARLLDQGKLSGEEVFEIINQTLSDVQNNPLIHPSSPLPVSLLLPGEEASGIAS
jgi:hypothetical protein